MKNDIAVGTLVRWYIYDGLGSVVGEVDPSGSTTAPAKYDVYGAKRAGGTGTATSRQGFVGALGHVTDDETGLVYMRRGTTTRRRGGLFQRIRREVEQTGTCIVVTTH